MRHARLVIVLVLAATVCGPVLAAVPALTPEVQTASWAQSWWMPRHEEKLAEVRERGKEVQLLFLGDSITHAWESRGQSVWEAFYGRRHALNLGFSGDRTEQVLWRLQHGEVEGLSPKAVVLMIGTNNTGHRQDPPEQTAAGVQAILDELATRLPRAKVLLLAIFPRGATADDPLRKLNDQVNERLAKLADDRRVFYLDISRAFVERDGVLPRSVMPDRLHPNAFGYRLWVQAIESKLRELLGEKPELGTPAVLSVWPGPVPGSVCDEPEKVLERSDGVTRITNVSSPTLTVYRGGRSRGAKPAIMICPGGGYHILAWDKEGLEIAAWLNRIGYGAAILKYRVPGNRDGALQDAQRALGLLRHRAAEWGFDPNRLGVLGFSAGGHLAARLSNNWGERNYEPVDAADAVSCRPDYTVLVYPAYLDANAGDLPAEIPVSQRTPPAFIVQTGDDAKYVGSSLAYHRALRAAGVPVELHLFPRGGHGYGLRPSPYPVVQWPDLCTTWMGRLIRP